MQLHLETTINDVFVISLELVRQTVVKLTLLHNQIHSLNHNQIRSQTLSQIPNQIHNLILNLILSQILSQSHSLSPNQTRLPSQTFIPLGRLYKKSEIHLTTVIATTQEHSTKWIEKSNSWKTKFFNFMKLLSSMAFYEPFAGFIL